MEDAVKGIDVTIRIAMGVAPGAAFAGFNYL